MSLSDKTTQEFKDIFKKEYGQDLTDAEAREQGERLLGFFEILYKQAQTEHLRKMRLENERVKGFFLEASDGQYTCAICGETLPGNEIWWNLDGMRCINCWRNIKEGVIPSLKHRYDDSNNWFQDWQLKSDYGIHSSTARKLRREGLLHGRDLKRKDEIIYYTVYLKSENQEFLKKYPKQKPQIQINVINKEEKKL